MAGKVGSLRTQAKSPPLSFCLPLFLSVSSLLVSFPLSRLSVFSRSVSIFPETTATSQALVHFFDTEALQQICRESDEHTDLSQSQVRNVKMINCLERGPKPRPGRRKRFSPLWQIFDDLGRAICHRSALWNPDTVTAGLQGGLAARRPMAGFLSSS